MAQKRKAPQAVPELIKSKDGRTQLGFDDPHRVELRASIKRLFGNDLEQIANFAAMVCEQSRTLEAERDELVQRLHGIHRMAAHLSSDADPKLKYVIAMISSTVPDDASRIFEGTAQIAQTIRSYRNTDKQHKGSREAKAHIQSLWKEQKEKYGGNKSKFARAQIPLLAEQFGVTISFDQVRDVWLSDNPGPKKSSRAASRRGMT